METDELDDLYQELILDHYRNPRNTKKLEDADIEARGFNPFCGDEVILDAALDGEGRIHEVGFDGRGCSISQASASMMTELLSGKTPAEAQVLATLFRDLMHGKELSEEERESLGDLEVLEGVRQYPIRIKCALLAWFALQEGIEEHLARSK